MKKRTLLLLIAPLFMSCASNQGGLSEEPTTSHEETSEVSKPERPNHPINSINHRGWFEAPENTLSAYRESKDRGFEMVECDISFTKDGKPVLLHDDTIDRTSNGSGNVRDYNLDDLKSLDFGSWKDEKYKNESIPTLEEFASLCKELSLYPYIELKKGASGEEAVSIVEIIDNVGLKGKVSYISYEVDLLIAIRNVDSKARLGLVCNNVFDSIIEKASSLKTDENEVFVDSYYSMLDSTGVNRCIESNIPLEVWTIDSEDAILKLDKYISGVTSNKLNAETVWNKATA